MILNDHLQNCSTHGDCRRRGAANVGANGVIQQIVQRTLFPHCACMRQAVARKSWEFAPASEYIVDVDADRVRARSSRVFLQRHGSRNSPHKMRPVAWGRPQPSLAYQTGRGTPRPVSRAPTSASPLSPSHLPKLSQRQPLGARGLREPEVQGRQCRAGVLGARQMQRVRSRKLRHKIADEYFRACEIRSIVAQRMRSRGEQIEARQSSRGFAWISRLVLADRVTTAGNSRRARSLTMIRWVVRLNQSRTRSESASSNTKATSTEVSA